MVKIGLILTFFCTWGLTLHAQWQRFPGEITSQYQVPFQQKSPDFANDTLWVMKHGEFLDSIAVINGVPHGKLRQYQNGMLRQTAVYQDGQLFGEVRFYHKDGWLLAETDYVQGKRNGNRKVFFSPETGHKTQIRARYYMDKLHGPVKTYYAPPAWGLHTRVSYFNGECKGDSSLYNKVGRMIFNVPLAKGKPVDSAETYYRNGDVYERFWLQDSLADTFKVNLYSTDGHFVHTNTYINQEPHGLILGFDGRGREVLHAHYRNGVLHGLLKQYDDQAKLQWTAEYENGQLNGYKTLYENGKITHKWHYQDGLLNGTSYTYNEEGILEQSTEYRDSLKHGLEVVYFESGEPFYEIPFKDGLKHGREKWYNKRGRRLTKNRWKHGVCKKEHQEYYPFGKLKMVYYFDSEGNGYRFDNYNGKKFADKQYFLHHEEVSEEAYKNWKKQQ